MQPKLFPRTSQKLNALNSARLLKQGRTIGHYTSTLPGIACLPTSSPALQTMWRFKKRTGPFLLLADSKQTARSFIRWYPPGLRKMIKTSWPGHTTLIVPGRPGLPSACYQKSMLAIRVDANTPCRRLAKACDGILLSSSLNRKGGAVRKPCYGVHMRWHRFLSGRANTGGSRDKASEIFRINHRGSKRLR